MTTYATYEEKREGILASAAEAKKPRMMSDREQAIVQKIMLANDKIKKISGIKKKLFDMLPYQEPIVGKITENAAEKLMTIVVDRPAGGFVTYAEKHFDMKAKTTKADMKTLEIS